MDNVGLVFFSGTFKDISQYHGDCEINFDVFRHFH